MNAAAAFFQSFGEMNLLVLKTFRAAIKRPFEINASFYQVFRLGVESLSIALLTATFSGLVLALQFGYAMKRFGTEGYIGNVVATSILRELGPVLTALMVGGRIGAGITAELGSMAVSEQIDAMRALGADPVKKLIVPRVVAAMIILPILTAFADIIGVASAMLLANLEFGIPYSFFYHKMFNTLQLADFVSGVGKSLFFGFFIGLISCYYGFKTKGGTEGVGLATTKTVVLTSVNTLIADFILTKIFLLL